MRISGVRLQVGVVNVSSADYGRSTAVLGEGSNAIVWPQGPWEDDEDLEEVERYNNQRLMRIGAHTTSVSIL